MKRITLFIALIMIFAVSTAYAAPEFIVSYNSESEAVTLNGSGNGIITVRILDSEVEPGELSDANLPLEFHQFVANGSFEHTLYMPFFALSGKYSVYLTDKDGVSKKNFVYYQKDLADTIIEEEINTSASEEEFILNVTNNASTLGIDEDDADYKPDVLPLMYSLYERYADSVDFNSRLKFCMAVCALKGSEDVAGVLRTYASVLGIDYSADFENNSYLTQESKEKICEYLSAMDYASDYKSIKSLTGETDFMSTYTAYMALSSVNSTDSWIAVKKIYNDDFDFLKNSVVKKNSSYKSSMSDDVFRKMQEYVYDDIEDLKENFDKAVKKVKSSETSSSAGGGGGGGGGGSTGNDHSISASVSDKSDIPYETLPEDESAGSGKMPVIEGKVAYSDVPEMAWYYEAVSSLGGSGIISGYEDGTYRPDNTITRAEFAKLIVSAFSVTAKAGSFSDVNLTDWYAPYISNAAGAGLIMGSDGMFRPGEPISRQDAAVILHRTAKLLNVEYVGFRQTSDMESVALYAWTAVGTLYYNQVIDGVGKGVFAPTETITRAQAAQMLYNIINDMSRRLGGGE